MKLRARAFRSCARWSQCAATVLLLLLPGCQAFAPDFAEFGGERVRSLRDRAAQQDTMLELRLEMLLPDLLERAGIDCWLLVADGPASDPMLSMLTASGTRLNGKGALLLCGGDTPVRVAIGRGLGANEAAYEVIEPSAEEPLEAILVRRLQAVEPRRIGINDARSFAPADGLSASNARWLRDHLPAELADRLVSARQVAEEFLAYQLEVEAPLFAESARLTAAILDEVLSDRVVVAAGTSLADLDWAVRERAALLDVELAHAAVATVYRPGAALDSERRMGLDLILQPGDLVFLSAGVRYLGYANRLGRWAYLLPSGERNAPQWVAGAMNELADAAEQFVASLQPGQSQADIGAMSGDALGGLSTAVAAVDRVGRLIEGPADPLHRAVAHGWHPDFRAAADTGLAITLRAEVAPPVPGATPLDMLLVGPALVTADGARWVIPPQRAPLLID